MAKKKILFHQDNIPCHKSKKITMEKLHELKIELLPHPPYSPDLTPSDYWLFANLKKMLAGKKFRSNEVVINETDTYFETKNKSFYKNGIKMLERRWNDCVALDGDYVDE
jgi:histone-lysine N-methyltransferase SETMAR